jgi:hypothetical protein
LSRSFTVRVIVCGALLAAFGGTANAQGHFFVGARNLGMGNTGVATTTNGMAVHYNPAGMAFDHGWDLQVPLVTVDATIGGDLFDRVDQVQDIFDSSRLGEIQDRFNNGTASSLDLQAALDAFLYALPDLELSQQGGNVRAYSGPAFRWKNWGVSAGFLGNGGADATIDLQNGLNLGSLGFAGAIPNPTPNACAGDATCLGLASDLIAASGGTLDQDRAETLVAAAGSALSDNQQAQDILTRIVQETAAGGDLLADNQTGVLTSVIGAVQFAGTYSHMIIEDKLSVGGSLRLMQGRVERGLTSVANFEAGDEAFDNIFDSITEREGNTSTEFAVDVGVMYRPTPKWSRGLSGMSLNGPSFTLPGDAPDFDIDPAVTIGGAYRPLRWFNVAMDFDVIEVDSGVIPDLGYRYVNLGVEFLAGRWFSGWLGGYENLALENGDPVLTLGAGFRAGRFEIALSGALSTQETKLSSGEDDKTFPNAAAASITLSWQPKRLP